MTRLSIAALFVCVFASGCSRQTPAPADGQTAPAAPAAAEQPAASGLASPAQGEATTTEEKAADEEATLALKKWTGDLDGMIERRLIRVLTTYSKTTFFIDRGTQLGLVPDAFRLFEDDLNKKLKTKNVRVHVMFVPVAHDDLIPALLEGRGDLVASQKIVTEWRAEKVEFTNPTRTGISSFVITGPGVPPIAKAQDLADKEVYLRASDVSEPAVKEANARLAAAGKPPVKIRPAPEVLADEDIFEMVNAGMVPMSIMDDYVATFWQQIFPDVVLNKGATVRTNRQTAMMVRKNSPQLMAELNAFIARYPEGSLQRNVLTQKYLKNVKYAKGATSGQDLARFRQTADFIRKYSAQYDLDYLLMAAQGYQESQLDQSKRSPVGAIGIMQVMPQTAKDPNVGIPGIEQAEANVHAGVRYLRFLRDRYFSEPELTVLDRTLFSFAAYNAGPGNVRKARRRAEKLGLDPNVWLDNVEIAADMVISREPVTYVRNIYKYYVAYRSIAA